MGGTGMNWDILGQTGVNWGGGDYNTVGVGVGVGAEPTGTDWEGQRWPRGDAGGGSRW